MLTVAVAAVLVAVSMSIAMRPTLSGTSWVLVAPAVPYALLTILAVVHMRREGTLGEKLRPRSGDLTFGALVAAMLYFGALAARMVLAGADRRTTIRIARRSASPSRSTRS